MGTTPACTFSSSKPSIPTKTLVKHIKRRDWSACRNRIQTYPWDAHYVKEKTTPLHLVCVYRAPLEVVQSLVDANPSAISARNESGWTPIHLIVLHGSEPEVALLLIERGGVEACSVESPFSGSPLHLACLHGSSQVVLRAIVAANPSMVSRGASGDNAGPKPAEQLWHRFCKNPANRELLMVGVQGRKQMNVQQASDAQDLLGRIQVLLDGYDLSMGKRNNDNKIPVTVINGSNMNAYSQSGETTAAAAILYQVVNNQPAIGDLNDFLDVAISSFPESQLRYVDNKTGNWLLHAACSRPSSRRQRHGRNGMSLHHRDRDLIEVLVDALPCAVAVKNQDGDYPLHLSLTMGRRTWRSGVSALVDARSQVVQVRDRDSGLYPFQMAASAAASVPNDDSAEESECLETIYHLLLACPHVLIHGQQ
jgi:ankyrin repeat protein